MRLRFAQTQPISIAPAPTDGGRAKMKFEILPLTAATGRCLSLENDPFPLLGRLVPRYDGRTWTVGEELWETAGEKTYPPDPFEPADYMDSPDKALFLALAGEACLGRIRIGKSWNGDGRVEDLAVRRPCRGRGVGTALMDAAVAWAEEKGLDGLTLETQDNNLPACRFYLKYGFVLGGIDARVYHHTPHRKETALYFYLPLSL